MPDPTAILRIHVRRVRVPGLIPEIGMFLRTIVWHASGRLPFAMRRWRWTMLRNVAMTNRTLTGLLMATVLLTAVFRTTLTAMFVAMLAQSGADL